MYRVFVNPYKGKKYERSRDHSYNDAIKTINDFIDSRKKTFKNASWKVKISTCREHDCVGHSRSSCRPCTYQCDLYLKTSNHAWVITAECFDPETGERVVCHEYASNCSCDTTEDQSSEE